MFFRSFSFSIIFSSSKVLNNSLFALWSFFRTFHLYFIVRGFHSLKFPFFILVVCKHISFSSFRFFFVFRLYFPMKILFYIIFSSLRMNFLIFSFYFCIIRFLRMFIRCGMLLCAFRWCLICMLLC